jgi:hypothetical protein
MDYKDGIKKPPHFEECGGQDLHRKMVFNTNLTAIHYRSVFLDAVA